MSTPQRPNAHQGNGWKNASARRGRPPKQMPVIPTDWSILLQSLSLEEDGAENDARVRNWIKGHYRTRYVPEKIMDKLGYPQDMQ